MIAVCTPTRNRRWAWEWSRMCLDHQDRQDLVWIIVDNSDDPAQSWEVAKSHPKVQYHAVPGKQTVGALRNRCLEFALQTEAEYVVFWDDDDYYPPTRISSGIRTLEQNPKAMYSGCSVLYLLLTQENLLLKVGPYGNQHSTAATWTIRRALAETRRFDETAAKAEESSFTNDWRVPMAVVAPEETILVMGHSHNTVNKSEVGRDPKRYLAATVNSANGKMVARVRWFQTPEVWDTWKSTFFGASNGPLPVTTSGSPTTASAEPVTAHTEAPAASDECHVDIPQLKSPHLHAETATGSLPPVEGSTG